MGQRLSLPQPRLMQAGFYWVVACGRRDNAVKRGAFLFSEDAANFAKQLDEQGHAVNVGHTVFGWCDMFDAREPADTGAKIMDQFHLEFMRDPWHAKRFKDAQTKGSFEESK